MKIKNIFVDLDNTLIDTSRGIVECCRKENPKMNIPEYGTVELDWKFSNYNLPKDYWKHFANAKAYKKEYTIEDAITTLKILKDRGYRLFVLTRSNMGLDMKMSKLWEYFPFMDGAIKTGQRAGRMVVVTISSAIPFAIFPITSAVAGATRIQSAEVPREI